MKAFTKIVEFPFSAYRYGMLALFFSLSALGLKAETEERYETFPVTLPTGYYVETITVSYSPDVIIDGYAEFTDPSITDLEISLEIANDGLHAYMHISRADDQPFDGTESAAVAGLGSMVVIDLSKTLVPPQVTYSYSLEPRSSSLGLAVGHCYPNPSAKGSPMAIQFPKGAAAAAILDPNGNQVSDWKPAPSAGILSCESPSRAGMYLVLFRNAEGAIISRARIMVLD